MRVSFGSLASQGRLLFSDGYRTKGSELASAGFRILRAGDIRNGQPIFESPDYVHQGLASGIGGKIVQAGDVVLTTKGTVGRTALVKKAPDTPAVYSPQLCFFRPDSGVLLPEYLYFWFSSPEFRHQSSSLKSSTDMAPYISLSQLNGVTITLAPPSIQQAIADVLGALDDKIAANSRLVEVSQDLLKAMHFQTLTCGATELTYSEIAAVGGGGTPSTKKEQYWGGSIRWAAPSDITALEAPYLDDTPRHITESGLAACSSPLYPAGSIFMTSRATIGAFAIPQAPTAVNQGFIVVQPHDGTMKWWLFHEMQRRVPEYVNRANGATFLELPRGVLKSMTIALPSRETIQSFRERAEVLHARSLAAVRESRTLAQLRDTLLPALMDGRLRVRDAIEQVEGNL